MHLFCCFLHREKTFSVHLKNFVLYNHRTVWVTSSQNFFCSFTLQLNESCWLVSFISYSSVSLSCRITETVELALCCIMSEINCVVKLLYTCVAHDVQWHLCSCFIEGETKSLKRLHEEFDVFKNIECKDVNHHMLQHIDGVMSGLNTSWNAMIFLYNLHYSPSTVTC